MTPEEALDKAVAYIGSMQILADHLRVTKGAVSQWKLEGRRIPAEHCPTIERLTSGEVRCEVLRPDVDWDQVRNSPDPARSTVARRSTDPLPLPSRAGRAPANRDRIMTASADIPQPPDLLQ